MNKNTFVEMDDFSSLQAEKMEFANERYRKVAESLEKLSILEPMLLTGNRLLKAAGIEATSDANEKQVDIDSLKNGLHELLLKKNTYQSGPRLTLTASDVEANRERGFMYQVFEFRDSDAQNLAFFIDMIASFQHELEGYLTNRYELSESERNAMIKDTTHHLRENIDHLMKILTGFFGD